MPGFVFPPVQLSDRFHAARLKTLSLATIQHLLSFVNTITRHNHVHKWLMFHSEWRQQTTLLCNKTLVSNIVPTQLQEALSLAQSRVKLDRGEKYFYYIPK
jgi:hypothetical protein